MDLDMNIPSHAQLYNTVSLILADKCLQGERIYFSQRLACTERVMETIDGWLDQYRRYETLSYREIKEEKGD